MFALVPRIPYVGRDIEGIYVLHITLDVLWLVKLKGWPNVRLFVCPNLEVFMSASGCIVLIVLIVLNSRVRIRKPVFINKITIKVEKLE